MQLEDLAGEILVETPAAIDPGDRIGADRLGVVQIEKHRRMSLGGEQQVSKSAEHMRADRLALIAAGHDRSIEADAEMV